MCSVPANITATSTVPCDQTTAYAIIPLLIRMITLPASVVVVLLQAFLCGQCKRCGECGAWRSLKPRSTFCCASICMMWMGYICPSGLVAAYFTAPNFTDGSDAEQFLAGLFNTGLSFFGLHTILILLRIKFTISRWQTLLTCEFFKTAFIVHVAYGLTKIDMTKFDSQGRLSFYAWIVFSQVPLVVISCVRLALWIRSGCNIEKFESSYLGHESDCPITRCCCKDSKFCGYQQSKVTPKGGATEGSTAGPPVIAQEHSGKQAGISMNQRTASCVEVKPFVQDKDNHAMNE